MTEPQYDLIELHAATNRAIALAHNDKSIGGPVNWGDLKCIDARKWQNNYGETGYSVLIDEASPEADQFCTFIHKKLAEFGFQGIEVNTEW